MTPAPRSLTSQSAKEREGERETENGWFKSTRVKHITVSGHTKLDANHKTDIRAPTVGGKATRVI